MKIYVRSSQDIDSFDAYDYLTNPDDYPEEINDELGKYSEKATGGDWRQVNNGEHYEKELQELDMDIYSDVKDRNGITIKLGDIVELTNRRYKKDNGEFCVVNLSRSRAKRWGMELGLIPIGSSGKVSRSILNEGMIKTYVDRKDSNNLEIVDDPVATESVRNLFYSLSDQYKEEAQHLLDKYTDIFGDPKYIPIHERWMIQYSKMKYELYQDAADEM